MKIIEIKKFDSFIKESIKKEKDCKEIDKKVDEKEIKKDDGDEPTKVEETLSFVDFVKNSDDKKPGDEPTKTDETLSFDKFVESKTGWSGDIDEPVVEDEIVEDAKTDEIDEKTNENIKSFQNFIK
ncbi:hypothetical protein M0Q50_02670 [bacterium]|jgi:hypothetical protein|nr:hypothetical protein [bacterium]